MEQHQVNENLEKVRANTIHNSTYACLFSSFATILGINCASCLMFMSDAQREHEEAREAPRTIEEDARTLKETVQRMEADNAAERAAIADL